VVNPEKVEKLGAAGVGNGYKLISREEPGHASFGDFQEDVIERSVHRYRLVPREQFTKTRHEIGEIYAVFSALEMVVVEDHQVFAQH
jgi:hypothetical protein